MPLTNPVCLALGQPQGSPIARLGLGKINGANDTKKKQFVKAQLSWGSHCGIFLEVNTD